MAEEQETQDIDQSEAPKRTALVVRNFVSSIVYDPENYTDPVFTAIESETAERGQRWTGTEFVDPVYCRQAVVVDGVVINVETAPEGFEHEDEARTYIPSETAQTGDLYENGEFTPPVVDPPLPPVPSPVLIASGTFQVANGDVGYSGEPAGIAFAMQVSTGVFWLYFSEEQADTSYAIYAGSSQGLVNYTDRQTDHFELSVTDGGAPIDPSEFSINVIITRAI